MDAQAAAPRRSDDYEDPPVTPEEKAHWAYKPPVRPAVPAGKAAGWGRNRIDTIRTQLLERSNYEIQTGRDRFSHPG